MDLTTLRSIDSLPGFRVSDRDGTVQDFLDTAHFPIGRFTPSPMALPAAVAGGQVVRLSVPGAIEVKGIGRPAAAAMDVRYEGGTISAAGSTTVVTEQHGIEVPKAADFVSVDSNITVEFALTLTRT
jgi:polyisoprenoid-binding protein YceI